MLSRRAMIAALPAIAAAAQQARAQQRFAFFTPAQAREIEAVAAQIIPSDATAGATEAGVVYFIDRVLAGYDRAMQPVYRAGLADLAARHRSFAGLDAKRQVEVLRSIEKSDFFQAVRTHTIMGFLANPSYGGNRDQAGWKAIGFTGAHVYRPPFGEYDK